MDRRTSITKYLDWPTLLLYLLLVLLGWMNIHSAAFDASNPSIFSLNTEYGKQFVWICTAIFIGAIILLLEGSFFSKFALLFYSLSILLLILVLLIGREVHGARAWFGYGAFGIQPSEFAKPALALAMAQYLSGLLPRRTDLFRTVVVPIFLIGLPVGLIMLQPDTGTALIFLAFLIVLYREGWSGNILFGGFVLVLLTVSTILLRGTSFPIPFTEWKIPGAYLLMIGFLLIALLVNYVALKFRGTKRRGRSYLILIMVVLTCSAYIFGVDRSFEKFLNPHQQERVQILLGTMEDPQGAGYNVEQAQTAIGSGGFSGKGYKEGPLTKYKYVPMQSTDFIFCTIGEEWGFIGASLIVILFMILLIRIVMIAERQRSSFTRIYAYSVLSILFIHFAINIGMAIGLAPVIGIPLPFFSYGGSSLWAFTILLFILLRLDGERLMVLR